MQTQGFGIREVVGLLPPWREKLFFGVYFRGVETAFNKWSSGLGLGYPCGPETLVKPIEN